MLMTLASESGPVTAIALSADHTFVATGHEDGSIFTWDLQRPTAPVKHIPSIGQKETPSKSGHLHGTMITHICFVGSRHSTLLSGDRLGMVFYHYINKRLLLGNIDTIRILGRYPSTSTLDRMKPSSVWFSAALPLGSVAHYTDSLGIAAILTPHKLVVVSTFPVARTQFKLNRPSGSIAEASEVSGCATWYPSVQSFQYVSPSQNRVVGTKPMLAIAWSRRLLVLTLDEAKYEAKDRAGDATVTHVSLSLGKEYTCDETIVAMQWYSHEILCLLTQSKRCLMLDIVTLHLIADCDLLFTHILHRDIGSSHLKMYFEARESEYVNQTFTDDYSQSFSLYKGKFFLLGAQHLLIGTMLSWADRVMALISDFQHIEAIELLIAYHDGSTEIRGLGLPSDTLQRKAKMSAKLKETILSTVKYATNSEDMSLRSDNYHTKLLEICFDAMLALNESQFLFRDVYDIYDEIDYTEPYLKILAKHILNDRLSDIPPQIVQALIQYFANQALYNRMEDLICRLHPHSLDANFILQMSYKHQLYNALTYTMTEVLLDFVAPAVEYITLVKAVLGTIHEGSDKLSLEDTRHLNSNTVNAVKVFSYLSLTLTGRVFPRATKRDSEVADLAKISVYDFLFSGTNKMWPPGSGEWLLSDMEKPEPTFPYLRLLLSFDCPTFLACMDEAFEDPVLNDSSPSTSRSGESVRKSITRQFITNILLEVMSTGFAQEDLLYLYMFIARNVPKYPQFILLSGSVLEKVIIGLCQYDDSEVADDCQLSVEYILSVFKPANSTQMLTYLKDAGFYRVLQSIYRSERQWTALLEAHLKSSQRENDIFACIVELLNPASKLSSRETDDITNMVLENIVAIASLDGTRTADVVERCLPQLHKTIFRKLLNREGLLYIYLKHLMDATTAHHEWMDCEVHEKYVDLLCIYDRHSIPQYLRTLDLSNIDIDRVIQILEKYDAIESIATLLSVQGKRSAALDRVLKLLNKTTVDFYKDDSTSAGSAFNYGTFKTYAIVAANLCASESENHKPSGRPSTSSNGHGELSIAGRMWIDLLTCLHAGLATSFKREGTTRKQRRKLLLIYEEVFQKLLISTARPTPEPFVKILKIFLQRIEYTPDDLLEIKVILAEACSFHQFEFSLLQLATRILDESLFHNFEQKTRLNSRGWKFDLTTCVLCGRANSSIEDHGMEIRSRSLLNAQSRQQRRAERLLNVERRHGLLDTGAGDKKVRETIAPSGDQGMESVNEDDSAVGERVIMFYACGHLAHERCYKDWKRDNNQEDVCCPANCSVVAADSESSQETIVPSMY